MQQQQTKKTHKPTNYFLASFKKTKITKKKKKYLPREKKNTKNKKKKYTFHDIGNVF